MFNIVESGFSYKVDKKAVIAFYNAANKIAAGRIKSSDDIPENARGKLVYNLKFEREVDALPGSDKTLLSWVRMLVLLIHGDRKGRKTINKINAFIENTGQKKLAIDIEIDLQVIVENVKDLKKAGKLVRNFIYAMMLPKKRIKDV